jgi:lysozyme family protein
MGFVKPIVSLIEYKAMFDSMQVDEDKASEISKAVALINKGKQRYLSVTAKLNLKCPWYALGIVHYLEGSCNFSKHIHNGDPLTARTWQVPAGRPLLPPQFGKSYTWEESAEDWFRLKNWHKWQDWGVQDMLYRFEANNGFGYRKRSVATPYLWSYSDHYDKGKFVADGKYDADAVSKQVGAAILLKELL